MFFHGDELDQIIAGGVTPRLQGEIYKADASKGRTAREACNDAGASPPKHQSDILLTMYRNTCTNCGKVHEAYGFLSQRITQSTDQGIITRSSVIAACAHNEQPAKTEWQELKVPYCPECVT